MERNLGDLKDLVQQAHKVIGQSRRTRVGASSLMMPKLHLRKPVMLSAAASPKAQEHCRLPILSPQTNSLEITVRASNDVAKNSKDNKIADLEFNAEDDKLVSINASNVETVRTLHTD